MAWGSKKPPTRVLVVRHGQTVSNREGRFCGQSETSLTPLGIAQARALARRLASTPIAAAYTSDFSRAIDTAAIVTEGREIMRATDADLREIHYGEWEMRREREIAREQRDEFRRMVAEDPAWWPPGGETVGMVRARTLRAFSRAAGRHPHETVLLVTHGTAINCMIAEILGMDLAHTFRFEVGNCALSEVVVRPGKPMVTLLNDDWHLDGVRA